MTGKVDINGVAYNVIISDLTPADVLSIFRTDTSILRTDSILLHSAGAEQNSAKKVLIQHLISLMSSAVAEDVALTIEPYYDDKGVYQGMYWHYNGNWLHRTDTGEMIRVDDTAAEIALAADLAVKAAKEANDSAETARKTEKTVASNEEARVAAETIRKDNEQDRQAAEGKREQQAASDHVLAEQDHAASETATAGAFQQGNYAKTQGDRAKRIADYPDQIRSDGYVWKYDPESASAGADGYRKTGYKVDASLDFDALSQEQYETLVSRIKENMVFASTATCESIVGELT